MGSSTRGKGSLGEVSPLRVLVTIVSLAVLATVLGGLYLAGAPGKERMRQFDNQRINALQLIASSVDMFYDRNLRVPASMAELLAAPDVYLGKPGYGMMDQTVDPETKIPYEYRTLTDKTYELCAVFSLTSAEAAFDGRYPMEASAPVPYSVGPGYTGYKPTDWTHYGVGRACFTLNAQERTAREVCGLTNPCAAGSTCATLPNRKGSVCVPAGKECLAAGCSGDCVVAESYPVQVRCIP